MRSVAPCAVHDKILSTSANSLSLYVSSLSLWDKDRLMSYQEKKGERAREEGRERECVCTSVQDPELLSSRIRPKGVAKDKQRQ